MKISKEVVFYGSIWLMSGLCQFVDYYLFSNPQALYLGSASTALGVLATAIGLFWRWEPWERPLGITLLAISFSFSGMLALFVGGWILTPLFVLALVSFGIAWALYNGKAWGRAVAAVVAVLGILLSLIGLGNDGITYSPGILQAVYLLWYLGRPQVADFFGTDSIFNIEIPRKALIVPVLVSLACIPVLAHAYAEPPVYTIVADDFECWGTGGGGTGQIFSAKRSDMIDYSFEVVEGGPVRFYVETYEFPHQTIVSLVEWYSGSGSAIIPSTGEWELMVTSQATHMNVLIEMKVTQFSIRQLIMQLLMLNLCLTALLFSAIFAYKRMTLTLYA